MGLVYNSVNYNYVEFENSGRLNDITARLSDRNNMYCIELDEIDLKDSNLNIFVQKLEETFSGGLINCSGDNAKPAFIIPKLKLLNSIDHALGKKIKSYLNEISIYINGLCDCECSYCNQYFKQNLHCTKLESELDISSILNILKQVGIHRLSKINILGGNIFKYNNLEILLEKFANIYCDKLFFINYLNLIDFQSPKLILKDIKNSLKIAIHLPLQNNHNDFWNAFKNNPQVQWQFIVTTVEEFQFSLEIIKNYNLKKYEIKPFYTGLNMDFFEENVFLSKSDILKSQLSRRHIFQRETLNTFDFGKFIIFPDGQIYTNLNHPSIGNIRASFSELIFKEISDGRAWRRTRINSEPCKSCIYNLLCPSPSNYEIVMDKMDLCLISSNIQFK